MFELFLLNSVSQTSAEKSGWPNSLTIVGQFFYLAIVCVFVCFLAYYATKFIANTRAIKGSGSNLKIIEAISAGGQAYIQLLQVGKRFFLISVTKEKIELLSEIEEKDIIFRGENVGEIKIPFEKYFNKLLPKNVDIDRGDKDEEKL